SATTAPARGDMRIEIAVNMGTRLLALDPEMHTGSAGIELSTGGKVDYVVMPVVANMPAKGTAAESKSLFKIAPVVQEPMERLYYPGQSRPASSNSSEQQVRPAIKSLEEESRQDYGTLRATAHRIEAAIAVSSLGAVWMVARKAALVASLLSSVPAWMRLDPLPILGDDQASDDASANEKSEEQDESVERMFTVERQLTEPSQLRS
ncbi:MAG: hypothetical protein ACRYGK_05575, partial [Janthinobacterium lividum]